MPLHRGKIATPPDIVSIRPLTREDLALIDTDRGVSKSRAGSGAVARFRDPHHRVARLFAQGLRMHEVVEHLGGQYSYNRVNTLYRDPAFQELIAAYRAKVDEAFIENVDEFHRLATSNMRKAETMIAERLEEAEETGEAIPLKTLESLASSRMDRFGYGKRETRLNVNMDFAAQLEGAIARSGKAKVIEATAPQLLPQSAPGVHSPLPVSSEQPTIHESQAGTAGSIPATRVTAERLVSRPVTSQPALDRRILRRA